MELAFLTNAVRRYYWVIVLAAILGLMPAFLLGPSGPDQYESRAVVLVSPPTQSFLEFSFNGDPDRYVAGQLSVLQSQGLAEQVAETVGDDLTASDVASAVRFDQEPLTDVVHIVSATPDPERSEAIAAAYVQLYFEQLRAQLDASQKPELDRIDGELDTLSTQLADVDRRMVAAIQPYLDNSPIPSLEQIAPGLVSEKSILLNEYAELQAARGELSNGLHVGSQIVQNASSPTEPLPTSNRKLLVVGVAAGLFAGLLAVAVMARLSPTVLSDDQAEEILGRPVAGSFPSLPGLGHNRGAILGDLTPAAAHFVESLAVRVGTAARGRGTLSVVVTGTQRGAGATTLAAALAHRMASPSTRVLLVDADVRDAELTALFVHDKSRIPARVGAWRVADSPEENEDALTPTAVPNLHVADLSTLESLTRRRAGGESARRPEASELLAAASEQADVVVFDGGPLMSAVSTIQLAWVADAVVLAMPPNQRIRGLKAVADELTHQQVLPVWTAAHRRGAR